MKPLSVIIPTKEEALCLVKTVAELRASFGDQIEEIIVVDARSQDGTAALAQELSCRVLLQENSGYGNAVMLGLRAAQAPYIVFFDADGSYDPKYLPQFLQHLQNGNCEAVFGTRYHKDSGSDDDTLIRYLGNQFFTWLMRLLFGVKLSDSLHLYAMVKREAAQSLSMESPHFAWCVEFPIRLAQAGLRYREVPTRERPRLAGESKVKVWSDGWNILWALFRWRVGQ